MFTLFTLFIIAIMASIPLILHPPTSPNCSLEILPAIIIDPIHDTPPYPPNILIRRNLFPLPRIPVDPRHQDGLLGVDSLAVLLPAEDRKRAVSFVSVLTKQEFEKLALLLVEKAVDAVSDVESVGMEINVTGLFGL